MAENVKPIKVLLIASGDLWAGAEAVVHQLVVGLRTRPLIHISLVLLNHGRLEKLCLEAGIATWVIDERRYGFPLIFMKLIKICRSIRPDIIHAHRYKENFLAVLTSFFCGRPRLVTTVHGLSEGNVNTIKGVLRKRIDEFLKRQIIDKIVVVSNDISRNLAESENINNNKIVIILNGVDAQKNITKKQLSQKHKITIGSAGRLFPVKDYLLMVDIARQTCAKKNNAYFVLAGEGPDKKSIIEKVKSYGLEKHFLLLGHMEDMDAFYGSLDIYINTSKHEGIPMTVLEAMDRCIPVVAFAVGGLREIVSHGQNGYLIQDRDAGKFSQHLIDLVDNHDKLIKFGEGAKQTVQKRFSSTQMVEDYCCLYNGLMIENNV